jgi:signal transduction histidine kinase
VNPDSDAGFDTTRAGRSPRRTDPFSPSAPRRPAPATALGASLERVLRRRGDWAPHALDGDEARLHAEWIRRMVLGEGAAEEASGWTASQRTLTRRLVDLVRQDLLERETHLPAQKLLELVREMESLRGRLTPPPQQILATRLMGANAADLVVELAHDLRSPLTSIMFLAETLRRGQSGEINDIQRQQLGIMYSAALNLSSIASDLVDLAREDVLLAEEAGAATPLSIQETFDSVRAIVAPMAEEKALGLVFRGPEQDLRLGNAISLGRVLLNLTTNGIKFTETGQIEIVARETDAQRVEFSVRDTGRGIEPEGLRKLYQPFHRSPSRTGLHFSGTGVGLSICRRLVELMGGSLEVETAVGRGTRFFFELEMPPARKL